MKQWAKKEYVASTGRARPPATHRTTGGLSLGSWVCTQRATRSLLNPERIALLENLKGWSWDPLVDQWNEAFECLKEYVASTGRARPPATHKTTDGFSLGMWVSVQRRKKESLTPERKRLLQSLDGWSWGAKKASKSKKK